MKILSKYKNYRRLYAAGAITELGSFVTDTALLLLVYELNSSKADLGILRATFLLFLTLGGVLGGPLGEKYNRRKLLIFCEVARIPFVLIVFIAPQFSTILISQATIAFFTGIFRPSRQALINEVVPFKEIKTANNLQGSTIALIHMISPILGAGLFTLLGGIKVILALDFLSYLFGAILLFRINYKPTSQKTPEETNLFEDLKKGFTYLKTRGDMKALFANSLVAGLAIGVLFPLLLPFTIEILAKTKFEYGILMGVFGVGGFLGGMLSQKLLRYRSPGKLSIYTVVLEPIIFLAWIHMLNFYLSLFVIFIWGVLVFVRVTSQLNYISENTHTEQLTKVHSFNELFFIVPNMVGGILIGIYGSRIETYQVLLLTGVLFLIITMFRFFFKNIYELYHGNSRINERETYLE